MVAEPTIDRSSVEAVMNRYPRGEANALVHLLQDVQTEFNYLPKVTLESAAEYLDLPLSKVYSVATFYKAFSLEPRGETIVKICLGTTCHIRGAPVVIDDLKQGLGIGLGETTEDMAYTLEVVNCVGACALAPVVITGERYLADVKPGTVMKRLKKA
jgi:NADH-quinone oxidoreductase subunit E